MINEKKLIQISKRLPVNAELRALGTKHIPTLIAYAWLDAQDIKERVFSHRSVEDYRLLISQWAGYDLDIKHLLSAVSLHPQLRVQGNHINVGGRMIEPSITRLNGFRKCAFTDADLRLCHHKGITRYSWHESVDYKLTRQPTKHSWPLQHGLRPHLEGTRSFSIARFATL